MHSIKLTVAYDGTDYHGWQIQPGQPTIQGSLTDVLQKITQERILIHAAGRTDAGVHAAGQVAHFKAHSELTAEEYQRAFNALLPPCIRVVAAEEVGPDFHARWNALAKTYQYRFYRGRVVPPFEWRFVLHYPYPLDEAVMMHAARQFEGEHDFTAFAASSGSEEEDKDRTTVRVIYSAEVVREGEELFFRVRGKSYLRYMVRKLAGTLIEAGKGRLQPEDVTALFESKDRSKSGMTLPPQGLCLLNVEYAEPWKG